MRSDATLSRRGFLKSSALLAAPAALSRSIRGADAPSERVTLASLGVGGRGTSSTA